MKKLLFVSLVALNITTIHAAMAAASVKPNAIGLRGGGGDIGGGVEISYQKAMGSANRLELDLGWSGGDNHSWIALSGIYQWVFNLTGGLNWYVGPGAQAGFYSFENSGNNSNDDDESGLTLGVGGQIGLEYDFNVHSVPLNLGLDVRPMFGFINHGGFGFGGALSLRYTF